MMPENLTPSEEDLGLESKSYRMTKELEYNNEVIFDNDEIRLVLPEKPLVAPEEGVHVRVEPKEAQKPYFDPEAKIGESLETFKSALAAARSVFGSQEQGDNYFWSQWVNVHLVPRFGGQNQLQVEVIGRNARGETWAQPVDYPEGEEYQKNPIVREEIEMIKREMLQNNRDIDNEISNEPIFNNEDYSGEPDEKTIYTFQNYEVRMARENPHVNEGGLHLWVHANTKEDEKYEGVQSGLRHGIEQFIIASAVAKSVYQELGVPIEIHFSGNWGLPVRGHWKENLSAHANLYGAPSSEEGAKLPPRPGFERPTIPEETRQKARQALEVNMAKYLNEFVGANLNQLL